GTVRPFGGVVMGLGAMAGSPPETEPERVPTPRRESAAESCLQEQGERPEVKRTDEVTVRRRQHARGQKRTQDRLVRRERGGKQHQGIGAAFGRLARNRIHYRGGGQIHDAGVVLVARSLRLVVVSLVIVMLVVEQSQRQV